jgi:hypothetical protein
MRVKAQSESARTTKHLLHTASNMESLPGNLRRLVVIARGTFFLYRIFKKVICKILHMGNMFSHLFNSLIPIQIQPESERVTFAVNEKITFSILH